METKANKLLKVHVENLRLRTIIGANDWEREKLQDVKISFCFKYDASKAVQSDDITDVLNYKSITKKIIASVEESQYQLLESLAELVYSIIKENSEAKDVVVTVEKPNALRFSDNVKISISDYDR